MDDFGDLYADVEVDVNSGIGGFCHLYIEEGERNESDQDNSQKNEIEADSVDRDNKVNGNDERLVGSDMEMPVLGADNENLTVENGSDSEDDLHIVLNEDDCRVFPTSRGTSIVNGGRKIGSDDEDEDDDLVIVTEADSLSKDRKWVDHLQLPIDGLDENTVGPGAESGNAMKGGYLSQYSQFKYVRPHLASLSSSVRNRESGGVVPFSSPMSTRGDWDSKGGSQQNNFGILSITQNGFGFSLPRNRTILDVGIETFEWKPWRHPGVDITDYFNFGLDEERWKNYCKSMENFRQQTTMQTKIPVYESLRPFQAYEAEFLQKTVAYETTSGEIAQNGLGERISSVTENVDGGGSSEMPKGRAILVEGGIGERRPSMDLRRPRHRDSDVVIQIALQDSTEDSSVSGKEETKHIDETLLDSSESAGSENNPCKESFDNSHGDVQPAIGVDGYNGRCSQPKAKCNSSYQGNDLHEDGITNLDRLCSEKLKEPIPEEDVEALDVEALEPAHGSQGRDEGYLYKADMKAESSFDSQIRHSSSPSYSESHSETSKVGVHGNMDEVYHHAKKQTSSSVTALQEPMMSESRHSNDSRSITNKTDEDNNANTQNQCPIQCAQNCCSGPRLRSVAESKVPLDEDEGSPRANRKSWDHEAHIRHGARREKKHAYDFIEKEDLSYYRETEISIGYRRRGLTEKQITRRACNNLFHRKDGLHSRKEIKEFLRSRDESEYFHERRDNELNERERYSWERGMSFSTPKESKLLLSRNNFYPEKEGYSLHKRKNENRHHLGKGADDDDFTLECRYREEFYEEKYGRDALYYGREEEPIEEQYKRDTPYYGREEESIQEKYRRHAPSLVGEIEFLGRHERHGCSTHFYSDCSPRSVESDGRYWRLPDSRPSSPQTCREFHIADGRGWRDDSPRSHMYYPWRSDARYGDQWGLPSFWKMHPKRIRDRGGFIPSSREHCYSSDDNGLDFDRDDHDADRRPSYPSNIVYNEKRRYNQQSKAADWRGNEASIGHQERDILYGHEASLQYERSSRRVHDRANHGYASGGKLSDNHHLHRGRKNTVVEGSRNSEDKRHISSISDHVERRKGETSVLKCRESVNIHVNGWEGKNPQRNSRNGDTNCNRDGPASHGADKESAAVRNSDKVQAWKEVPPPSPNAVSRRPRNINSKIERLATSSSEHLADRSNEKWLDKYPILQDQEASVLEEGQLAPEAAEGKAVGGGLRKRCFEETLPTSAIEVKKSRKENAVEENQVVRGYDNNRILETLAKMEKRRERFKEPSALKKEPDKIAKPLPEPAVETTDVQLQRPARKRRWGSSFIVPDTS